MKRTLLISLLAIPLLLACGESDDDGSGGSGDAAQISCEEFCDTLDGCPEVLEGDCLSQCEQLRTEAKADTGNTCDAKLTSTLACIESKLDEECGTSFVTIEPRVISILFIGSNACYSDIDVLNDACNELEGNRPPDKVP
jgi:hypothetical protein